MEVPSFVAVAAGIPVIAILLKWAVDRLYSNRRKDLVISGTANVVSVSASATNADIIGSVSTALTLEENVRKALELLGGADVEIVPERRGTVDFVVRSKGRIWGIEVKNSPRWVTSDQIRRDQSAAAKLDKVIFVTVGQFPQQVQASIGDLLQANKVALVGLPSAEADPADISRVLEAELH